MNNSLSSFHQLFIDLWRASMTPAGAGNETFVPRQSIMTDASGSMGQDVVVALSAETSLLKAARVH